MRYRVLYGRRRRRPLHAPKQRLGDLAAIRWSLTKLLGGAESRSHRAVKYNSLLAYPRWLEGCAASRIRRRRFRPARGHRRDSYDSSARLELFADLADYFRSLVRFQDAAIEGLSDEQFVGAVRVIYHPSGRSR